ncbi:hypothetical protein D9619_011464 [Psilocybe cf. subviscida]|uniref:Uncharacterized protein n=1 Tax=Psilocybe cf. subviscida TaxID=2480587 RepID=A0A8H5BT44_9AGAR|nr:hypothetical protein D9619_011464 [Psilocybe cf. subviscida]
MGLALMSHPIFPPDILPFIFKEINSRQDLYSVCLTSRIFRIEGQLILFRHPGVLKIGVEDLPHNSFLDAIIRSPNRLAPIVRSYEQNITWTTPLESEEITNMLLPIACAARKQEVVSSSKRSWLIERIGCALRLMVNIKVLKIWDKDNNQYHYPRPYLPDILQYCKFQLHSLTWDRTGEEKPIVSQFLPHQKDLKDLDLGRQYTGRLYADVVQPQQLTGICLRLDSLSGSIAMTSLFLVPNDSRKRPVKCLRWTSNPEAYWQHRNIEVKQLTGPLSKVQLLDYECEQRSPSLSELSSMLGKLTVLRMCVQDLTWTSRTWKEDIVALGRLPALRTLILSIYETRHGCAPHMANYDAPTKLSEQIFFCSKTLQCIDIHGLSSRAERHTRAAPSATLSSARIGSRSILKVCDEYCWSNRHCFLDDWIL